MPAFYLGFAEGGLCPAIPESLIEYGGKPILYCASDRLLFRYRNDSNSALELLSKLVFYTLTKLNILCMGRPWEAELVLGITKIDQT